MSSRILDALIFDPRLEIVKIVGTLIEEVRFFTFTIPIDREAIIRIAWKYKGDWSGVSDTDPLEVAMGIINYESSIEWPTDTDVVETRLTFGNNFHDGDILKSLQIERETGGKSHCWWQYLELRVIDWAS